MDGNRAYDAFVIILVMTAGVVIGGAIKNGFELNNLPHWITAFASLLLAATAASAMHYWRKQQQASKKSELAFQALSSYFTDMGLCNRYYVRTCEALIETQYRDFSTPNVAGALHCYQQSLVNVRERLSSELLYFALISESIKDLNIKAQETILRASIISPNEPEKLYRELVLAKIAVDELTHELAQHVQLKKL